MLFDAFDRFHFWDKSRCEVYGHRFHWTPQHHHPRDLHHYLYSYDELGAQALDRLEAISPEALKEGGCSHGDGAGQKDLLAILRENADNDEILGRLWAEVTTVPDWVDWKQIERGQQVVFQFNGPTLLGLLFTSLVGGMAAWRVVETLARTGGFSVPVTRRRLLETFQHFMDVISSLEEVQPPNGKGFTSTVRVRLLHAMVRKRLLKIEQRKPGYFDMDKLGIPINDLHSMGTICAYSCSLIWVALPRQGVFLSTQQIADYLALWRFVGHLLGTPVDFLSTPASAKAMMESIMMAEMSPSENSKILANNILTAETRTPPVHVSREYLAAEAHQLNGTALAEALGIERPHWWCRCLVIWQCTLLMWIGYIYPWLPRPARQKKDARFRRIANELVLSKRLGGSGMRTDFHLQYVPSAGKMTELGPCSKDTAMPAKTPLSAPAAWLSALATAGVVLTAIAVVGLSRWSGVLRGSWSVSPHCAPIVRSQPLRESVDVVDLIRP